MKFVFFALVFSCIFSMQLNAQSKNDTALYKIAYDYLVKSKEAKKKLGKLRGKRIFPKDHEMSLFYPCAKVEFINLARFSSVLSPCTCVTNIPESELKNKTKFEERYSFQPFEDSTLLEIANQGSRPFMSYLSFSMLIGNVLAFNMFLNEDPDMSNPCLQLESTKFGTAIVGFLVFDESITSVKKVLWKEIQMN